MTSKSKEPPDGAPQRSMRWPAYLAMLIVWSLFAGLFLLMAQSDGDFTPNARMGFIVAAAVCGLFTVLAVIKWISDAANAFVSEPDAWPPSGHAPTSWNSNERLHDSDDLETRESDEEPDSESDIELN